MDHMASAKGAPFAGAAQANRSVVTASQNYAHGLASQDREAAVLARSGKKQVLKRNFGLFSMIGLACSLLTTWEGILASFLLGFQNGGPAGLIYGLIVVWIGTLAVITTLGELASMAPTAGGQYHWVNLLAPSYCKKSLSYVTGWLSVAGWTAAVAAGLNYSSGLILAMAEQNNPNYETQGWHGTLVYWAVLLLCICINTKLNRLLPAIEVLVLVLHILGCFAILIPLVYLYPKDNTNAIFSTWNNGGGWSTQGLSFLIGLNGMAASFIGADGAVHMSEEVKSASINVPRAMFYSILINGASGFGLLIAFLWCADLSIATSSTAAFPFVPVLCDAVGSNAGGIAMVAIVTALTIFASMGAVAAASRMMWSFARDRGLPGWRTLSKVDPKTTIPFASVATVSAIAALLGLINIGSPLAFSDCLSLILEALYTSYFIVCSLFLYRRLRGQIGIPSASEIAYHTSEESDDPTKNPALFQWGRWHVPGMWGVLVNAVACIYLLVVSFFSFWPTEVEVTPETMNYSVLVTGAVAVLSLTYYAVWAKRTYRGPVVEIKLDETATMDITHAR